MAALHQDWRAHVKLGRLGAVLHQLLLKRQAEKVGLDKELKLAALNVPIDLVRLGRGGGG